MYFSILPLWSPRNRPTVDFSISSGSVIPSMMSSGSSVLPFDLDILSPSASRTMALMYTWRNGTLPVKCMVIMIIRATQKKMMSKPVMSTDEGRKRSRSSVFSGQPSEENGTSAEENHVSSTSSSRL